MVLQDIQKSWNTSLKCLTVEKIIYASDHFSITYLYRSFGARQATRPVAWTGIRYQGVEHTDFGQTIGQVQKIFCQSHHHTSHPSYDPSYGRVPFHFSMERGTGDPKSVCHLVTSRNTQDVTQSFVLESLLPDDQVALWCNGQKQQGVHERCPKFKTKIGVFLKLGETRVKVSDNKQEVDPEVERCFWLRICKDFVTVKQCSI